VELRGHTDSVGGESYNQALSLRRAEAVKVWLVACGVPEMQITTVGMGQVEPLSREDNEDARSANRRTEFWLR
jgi:outer membrane protein OmpA-like peptidoglycan-associated protein